MKPGIQCTFRSFIAFSLAFSVHPAIEGQTALDFFKVTAFNDKKEGMTRQEFMDYSTKTHVPLVLEMPGLRGYVLNFALPDDEAAPHDAVVELWFDSEEDFAKAMESEEGQRALADAPNFMKMPVQTMAVDEVIMVYPATQEEQPSYGYKATYIAQRNPDISWEEYQLIQLKDYAPIVNGFENIGGYVINFSKKDDAALPASAVVHVWFEDNATATKAFQSPNLKKIGELQERMLAEAPKSMLVREYVAMAPPVYPEK